MMLCSVMLCLSLVHILDNLFLLLALVFVIDFKGTMTGNHSKSISNHQEFKADERCIKVNIEFLHERHKNEPNSVCKMANI